MTEVKEEVTLFVKAGREAGRIGACLESQSAHLLARLKLTEVKDVLVDVANPPPEFTTAGFIKVPAVLLPDGTGTDEAVIDFLGKCDPEYETSHTYEESALEAAITATKDIYPAFCSYMEGGDIEILLELLQSLDEYLQKTDHQFLLGEKMSLLDCQMLPKLHELRVTMHRIKDSNIPSKLHHVWMYLFHAYLNSAFTKSCPPDMEILLDWLEKTGESSSNIKMPEWLPEEHHGNYHSFNVPNMCVCPPCP